MKVQAGEYGKKVNQALHHIVKTLLDSGHNLIIDDVADGGSEVRVWERELSGNSLTKIGVFCGLSELKIIPIVLSNYGISAVS